MSIDNFREKKWAFRVLDELCLRSCFANRKLLLFVSWWILIIMILNYAHQKRLYYLCQFCGDDLKKITLKTSRPRWRIPLGCWREALVLLLIYCGARPSGKFQWNEWSEIDQRHWFLVSKITSKVRFLMRLRPFEQNS